MGLMLGISLKTKKASDVLNEAFENGLLILTAKDKVRLLPPLNITYNELGLGLDILINILEK
jgi:acetylornithine/N-succinyldiaminopimelate aminotransferase